ncbi:shikimate kinase [Arenicella chitinivorans]|uniref:Shikimate kinase n=1 Tax=Arenicella chitinivorans TaxID=1329800 RepID=A0A918VSD4_9GAMM|nr:shikimate kinase AroK [Arenicella chitinivorans]GHA19999.1 shikimate kinase [Arenicella chitinivorans]
MQNLILIGPMGSGKTTVGKQLAKRMRMDFVDSDHMIEERCGVSISTIFDIEGEDGFRKRETKMLTELCERNGIVLATGGGAVISEENRILLRKGYVIYLKTSIETQLARTQKNQNRPLLENVDAETKLEELMEERGRLYEQEADLIVMSGDRIVSKVVDEITEALEQL